MAINVNRYLILFFLLVAAGISYVVGFTVGVSLFVGLGIIFEGLFWFKLISVRRRR